MREVWKLYKELLGALSTSARNFLIIYSLALGFLSILDSAALGLLALLIAPVAVGTTANLPIIGELDSTGLLIAIAILCVVIVAKGLISLLVLFWGARKAEAYEVMIGQRLFSAYIRSPWEKRLSRNSADIVRFTDGSVTVLVTSFLLPGATLLSEALSLISILVIISIAQPVTAITTLLYLGMLGLLLYFWVARRANNAGKVYLEFSLLTSRLIHGMVASMKEIALRGKLDEVNKVVEASRSRSTRARANIMFLGEIPRYALESGIIGGFALVGFVGYLMGGAIGAISSVALFSVAGFRMAPSVVRSQSVLTQLTANSPQAEIVLKEIKSSESAHKEYSVEEQLNLQHNPRTLTLDDVSFTYEGSSVPALKSMSIQIELGSTVAFVGPSGSGKSTLIDVILGFLKPQEGSVKLDDIHLVQVLDAWRKRLGYVPQEVSIFDGTIAENVALSWSGEFEVPKVREALRRAQIIDVVDARPDGINSKVGERGLSLSGGQRQRLGIARALYPEPWVLVMDEATSALDTKTEAEVNKAISVLKENTTLIIVAHRLSTIKQADKIFYLRDGSVIDFGTFEELIDRVPDFAHQAQLSGLA